LLGSSSYPPPKLISASCNGKKSIGASERKWEGGREGGREVGRVGTSSQEKKKLGSRMIGIKKKARKNKGTGKKMRGGKKAQHNFFKNNLKI
jgi:hypothetical protein